jgi:AcrR family transcriptional regulator
MDQRARRARTTEKLLKAAAEAFAERGFHGTTVDDVAERAGLTKGSVYSNFQSKDALFLALLDRHLESQLEQTERLLSFESTDDLRGALEEQTKKAGEDGNSLGLLTMEFWMYAMRNPEAMAALVVRYARMRGRLAELIDDRFTSRGVEPPRPPHDLATLVLAVDAGLFLQAMVDPPALPSGLRTDAIIALTDPDGGWGRSATRGA